MASVAIKGEMDADGTVRDRIFEDCEIVGPATIVPVGTDNDVIDCDYPWAVENVYQLRGGPRPKDLVLVVGCTFRRCNFALDVDATQMLASSTSASAAD
jgi:hypothetical protein